MTYRQKMGDAAGAAAGNLISSGWAAANQGAGMGGRVVGWWWSFNGLFWALAWASLTSLPIGWYRLIFAALSTVSLLITARAFGGMAARRGPRSTSLAEILGVCWELAKTRRALAVLVVLPIAFTVIGFGWVAGPINFSFFGLAPLMLAALFAAAAAVKAGHRIGDDSNRAAGSDFDFRIALAAALGVDSSKLEDSIFADRDGRITVSPVPNAVIGRLPGLESQLAQHLPDYEVAEASAARIVLRPASTETLTRREHAFRSGGLVTGLEATTSPGTAAGPDWSGWTGE